MSRNRLTTKTAAEAGDNDLYTMNGARPTGNINPGTKYEIGGPAEFGETPISQADTKKIHDKDVSDRDPETNIPELRKASEQAIRNAADLERKAIRCLVASQRMLPGAEQHVIEANAADLIRLPLASVDAILARQEAFARKVAEDASELEKDTGATPGALPAIKPEGEPAIKPAIKPEGERPTAAATPGAIPGDPAFDPAKMPADAAQQFQMMAAKIAALEEKLTGKPENGVGPFAEENAAGKEGCDKTASSLDAVFAAAQPAAAKKGVTSLSGMVHQASAAPSTTSLESLWVSAPDVTGLF